MTSTKSFLLGAILLTIGIHLSRISTLRNYFRYVIDRFSFIFSKIPTWKTVLVFSIAIPLLLVEMRPIRETDSLYGLNYIFDWLYKGTNPYVMLAGNPASWEVSYVSSLVITKSDIFFWMNNFLLVALIGIGIYKIGRELGISGRLSWLTAFSACMFFELWYDPSGIGTIKVDMSNTAGYVLVVLAIVKSINNGSKRLSLILFTTGAILTLAKQSGFAVITFGLVFILIFNWKKIYKIKKKSVLFGSIAILPILGVSGIYYLYKVIDYGNPFWPYKLTVFGYSIGQWTTDFGYTAIYSVMHDPKLYQYLLFTPSNIFAAGVLFPALLIFGYLGTPIIALIQFYRIISKKSNNRNLLFLAIFIFLMWMVYLFHWGGANSKAGDLEYVKHLANLRYAEGTLGLTELFVIYLLWLSRLPENLIIGILGINLVSRLVYNYGQIPYEKILHFGYIAIIAPILIAITLLLTRKQLQKKSIMLGTFFSIFIAAFFMQSYIVEKNRDFWYPQWQEVINSIYYQKSSTIFLVTTPVSHGGTKFWSTVYPLYGNNLQHSVRVITNDKLFAFFNTHDPKSYPDYLVELCNPNFSCMNDFNDFASKVKKYNYEPRAVEDKAISLQHIQSNSSMN